MREPVRRKSWFEDHWRAVGFVFQVLCVQLLSCVRFFMTPWTVALQAPLSMGFSRREYWSGLPCPPPGDIPNPGIEPESPVAPALQADSLPLYHWGSPCRQHPLWNLEHSEKEVQENMQSSSKLPWDEIGAARDRDIKKRCKSTQKNYERELY